MLSQDQFELMESKFFCGQLDTELFEKSKVLSPQLCCDHFRFLSDFGGTVAANAVDPNASTEHELQKAELARFKAKLGKEQSLFISFRKQLDAWEEAGLAQDAEQKDRLRKEQRNCIEKKQDQQYPVMDMPNCQAAMTFTEATVNKFIMDEEKTTCGTPLRVFWLNSSTLGYDSVSQVKLAVTELSTTLASNPQTSMMLVAMPTVGNWGNEYVESEVQEASKKILTELQEPHQWFGKSAFSSKRPRSLSNQSAQAITALQWQSQTKLMLMACFLCLQNLSCGRGRHARHQCNLSDSLWILAETSS